MGLLVERVDVWAATVEDRPGGLAGVLATLRGAGADLQFVIARRSPDQPGRGVAAARTQALADGGINLHGFSASVIGKQFVA